MDHPTRAPSRRHLLLLGALGLAACQPAAKAVCSDPSELTDAQIAIRASFAYAEAAPRKDQACAACAFFRRAAGEACGTCDLLKGPVNPGGHCTSWSARRA